MGRHVINQRVLGIAAVVVALTGLLVADQLMTNTARLLVGLCWAIPAGCTFSIYWWMRPMSTKPVFFTSGGIGLRARFIGSSVVDLDRLGLFLIGEARDALSAGSVPPTSRKELEVDLNGDLSNALESLKNTNCELASATISLEGVHGKIAEYESSLEDTREELARNKNSLENVRGELASWKSGIRKDLENLRAATASPAAPAIDSAQPRGNGQWPPCHYCGTRSRQNQDYQVKVAAGKTKDVCACNKCAADPAVSLGGTPQACQTPTKGMGHVVSP